MKTAKSLSAAGITAVVFCLLVSGCVIYPGGENLGDSYPGFPLKVRVALLESGVPSFESPEENLGLSLNSSISYVGSSIDELILLSYSDATEDHFDDYKEYLEGQFGDPYDQNPYGLNPDPEGPDYANGYYEWVVGNTVIDLCFAYDDVIDLGIPMNTLFILILPLG
jgi:hypothetical protein